MATTQPTADTTLYITRTFKAPAKKIFEAWTRSDVMSRWMAPSPEAKCVASAEGKIGGAYKVAMHMPDGNVHTGFGTYTEFDPYSRLAMTWSWEDSATQETLIRIDFVEKDGETQMRFTHERFQDSETRDKHGQGWNGCFAQLQAYIDA